MAVKTIYVRLVPAEANVRRCVNQDHISQAEMVLGPLTTTTNTLPEISHAIPAAFIEQDIRRRKNPF
jgi:hypothetical protein